MEADGGSGVGVREEGMLLDDNNDVVEGAFHPRMRRLWDSSASSRWRLGGDRIHNRLSGMKIDFIQ